MINPALEEYFGDPASVERLAAALDQVAQGLWALRGRLDTQVSGLVPAQWDGPGAAAFQRAWRERSAAVRQLAVTAERMSDTTRKLGAVLASTKSTFVAAEEHAAASQLLITPTAPVYRVVPAGEVDWRTPAAIAWVQSDVTTSQLMASEARGQARIELGAESLGASLGLLTDVGLGVVRGVGDLLRMVGGGVETVNRYSVDRLLVDAGGAGRDLGAAAAGAAKTVWSVLEASARLSDERRAVDPEGFQEDLKSYGEKYRQVLEPLVSSPGRVVAGVTELATTVAGPGLAAKALKLAGGADAAAAASAARESAAADAVASVKGTRWSARLGAAGEGANLKLLEQQGEKAVDLNSLPSVGKQANFRELDAMSGQGFDSVKVRDNPKQYVNDFRRLVDEDRSMASAEQLLDPRNSARLQELQTGGAWPRDLPASATADDVGAYMRDNARLKVPDDQVGQVRDLVGSDIRQLPENYGLPADVTPTDAQVQPFLDRVQSNGITSPAVKRLVPWPQ